MPPRKLHFSTTSKAPAWPDMRGQGRAPQQRHEPVDEYDDLHFSQELGLWRHLEDELFADMLNLANLFNKHWGVVEGIDYPYTRAIVSTTYNKTANPGAASTSTTSTASRRTASAPSPTFPSGRRRSARA